MGETVKVRQGSTEREGEEKRERKREGEQEGRWRMMNECVFACVRARRTFQTE